MSTTWDPPVHAQEVLLPTEPLGRRMVLQHRMAINSRHRPQEDQGLPPTKTIPHQHLLDDTTLHHQHQVLPVAGMVVVDNNSSLRTVITAMAVAVAITAMVVVVAITTTVSNHHPPEAILMEEALRGEARIHPWGMVDQIMNADLPILQQVVLHLMALHPAEAAVI